MAQTQGFTADGRLHAGWIGQGAAAPHSLVRLTHLLLVAGLPPCRKFRVWWAAILEASLECHAHGPRAQHVPSSPPSSPQAKEQETRPAIASPSTHHPSGPEVIQIDSQHPKRPHQYLHCINNPCHNELLPLHQELCAALDGLLLRRQCLFATSKANFDKEVNPFFFRSPLCLATQPGHGFLSSGLCNLIPI